MQKGAKASIETRLKQSIALKGHLVSDETKRKIGIANKGRGFKQGHVVTESMKEKISLGHLGEKNNSWNGGTSRKPYAFGFSTRLKLKIRKRNNFECVECGINENSLGRKLEVHHIDYDKNNNAENNLIALCKSCHSKTNFTRNDWKIYFMGKLAGCGLNECH